MKKWVRNAVLCSVAAVTIGVSVVGFMPKAHKTEAAVLVFDAENYAKILEEVAQTLKISEDVYTQLEYIVRNSDNINGAVRTVAERYINGQLHRLEDMSKREGLGSTKISLDGVWNEYFQDGIDLENGTVTVYDLYHKHSREDILLKTIHDALGDTKKNEELDRQVKEKLEVSEELAKKEDAGTNQILQDGNLNQSLDIMVNQENGRKLDNLVTMIGTKFGDETAKEREVRAAALNQMKHSVDSMNKVMDNAPTKKMPWDYKK